MRNLRRWTILVFALSLIAILSKDHAEAEGKNRDARAEVARMANSPCAQFYDHLVSYKHHIAAHELALSQYMGEYGDKLKREYSQFSRLEGHLNALPPGTFAGLKDLADHASSLDQMAVENTRYVTDELKELLSNFISHRCSIDP